MDARPSQPEPVHVAFCCDGGYLQPLTVSIQSLVETARQPSLLRIWIVTHGMAASELQLLENVATRAGAVLTRLDLADAETKLQGITARGHITKTAYFRLFLPDLLPPEVRRIIYLDSDVIVRRPIEDLAGVDLDGCAVGAVLKPRASEYADVGVPGPQDYFNSGVLVIDLISWHQQLLRERALEYLRLHPGAKYGHDQPALNYALCGRWKRLDLRWNQQFKFFVHTAGYLQLGPAEMRAVRRDPFIVHFTTASKPWHYDNSHPWRESYFSVLDRTPFAGWRPQAGSQRERWLRILTAWFPHTLRPGVLRNVVRPYYHAFRAHCRDLLPWTHSSPASESAR